MRKGRLRRPFLCQFTLPACGLLATQPVKYEIITTEVFFRWLSELEDKPWHNIQHHLIQSIISRATKRSGIRFIYSYRLVYHIESKRILIIAVIHGNRLLENVAELF